MNRSGDRACVAEQVQLWPDHSEVLMVELDHHGRVVGFSCARGDLRHETPEAEQARHLVEQLASKLRRADSLDELARRARVALDLVENLQALEALHGEAARRLLSRSPAPSGSR